MPHRYLAPRALLPSGWAADVLIEVGDDGFLSAIEPDAAGALYGGLERLAGPVLPGMANVHSHAFQRAMAGLTQRSTDSRDNFWSWRERMYQFLERLQPDDIEAIALQLYIEMLRAGYTAVAEFHYLHHDPAGRPYQRIAATGERISAAAERCGIALTLLPVLYAHGDFGGAPPTAGQRRFINDPIAFQTILGELAACVSRASLQRIGIAPHSLRAVTPDELTLAIEQLNAIDPHAPIHIHAAEQRLECEQCVRRTGLPPVRWLLENQPLDARWCLVHATHMDDAEAQDLAASGAVAGVCPTTEGDLGDGFFNAAAFLRANGALGIGGDSHVGVDPFAELRLFEYVQRLRTERRNVSVGGENVSCGEFLYARAALGGARALGQPIGALAIGARADWIVLNVNDAALAGHDASRGSILDAAIFGPARQPVLDVMVGGCWQVRSGRHALQDEALAAYRQVLRRLLG